MTGFALPGAGLTPVIRVIPQVKSRFHRATCTASAGHDAVRTGETASGLGAWQTTPTGSYSSDAAVLAAVQL